MMIWMAQLLDHYGPTDFDRNKVQNGSSGAEITLAPGQCTTVYETIELNSASQAAPDKLKFVVWAQNPTLIWNPQVQYIPPNWYGANFGEIYQGGNALPPFDGIFVDGFDNGETSAWSSAVP